MAVPKHLRYEIFRRDNHTCRYCGARPPEAILTVDHVTPEALGGSSDPANLVTACADCNAGKSATPPGAPLVDDVKQRDLEWARAVRAAAEVMHRDLDAKAHFADLFDAVWTGWEDSDGAPVVRPVGWAESIDQLRVIGLSGHELVDAVNIAMVAHGVVLEDKWRYFMGVCWRKVRKLHEIAGALADEARLRPPESGSH